MIEMCRQGAERNVRTIYDSVEWHTYIALHATLLGLPDNEFQDQMRAGLQRSEITFVRRMSHFYEQTSQLLRFRVRSTLADVGFDSLATLGAAVVEGLVISVTARDVDREHFESDPFGTGDVADGSLAALGFTGIVMTLVEASDQTTRPDVRLASVRRLLEAVIEA